MRFSGLEWSVTLGNHGFHVDVLLQLAFFFCLFVLVAV